MDDRELRASLRRLPEARPGEAFTAEVLARVERDERRRAASGGWAKDRGGAGPRWRPTLLAAGLAAGLVAAAGLWPPGGGWWWPADGGGEGVAGRAGAGDRARTGGEAAGAGGAGSGGGAAPAASEREPLDEGSGGRAAASDAARTAAGAEARGDAGGGGSNLRGADTAAGDVSPHRMATQRLPLVEGVRDETASGGSTRSEAPAGAPSTSPGAGFFAAPPAAPLPAAVRLARLREERERLEARLAAFRSELPPAEPPVVLLGADEGFDLVFDLGRWAAAPPAGTAPAAARPAVHSTGQPPRRF